MGNGVASAAALLMLMSGVATAGDQEIEQDDPLEEVPLWEQYFTLRGGVGYSDNILFSDLNQKSSGMLVSGFDVTFFRLPLDGTQINLFASIDDRRYLDGGVVTNLVTGSASTNRIDDLRGERVILGLLQVTRDFTPRLQAGLAGQYSYQDQVLDVSVTEADLGTLPVVGNQFLARAEGLARFGRNQRLLGEFEWQRQLFEQDEVDDYAEFGPRIGWGWDLPRASTLDLEYEALRRDYDSRNEYDLAGTPVAGTRLEYLTQTVGLEWKQHLDVAQRWRLLARAGFSDNADSGTGYFDYDRYTASLQLRYRHDPWEVQARGRVSWYRYDVQLSDEDPGERRERLVPQAALRITRTLNRSLRAFADYEFEQAQSNLSYDSYTVNVVSAGLEWEF